MFRTPLLNIALLLISLSFAAAVPAWAQWTTPTIDGSIGTGEYGTNNQLSNAGNTGQNWYMTWDSSNLYVGIANANVSEGLVLYVADPNNNNNGNLTGSNYDGASFSSLPFKATFVTYAKSGYREYRNANGSGRWTSSTAGYGQFADDGGGTREVAIPWSAITGGAMHQQGASGWRFDAADDGNFGHPWWNDYRTFAKSYNMNGPLIGEIWPNASQFLAGDQIDSVMNYRFRKNITGFVRNAEWHDDNNNGVNDIPGLTPSQFDHAIRAVRDDYPPQATAAMLNLLDSHDVNRALYAMTEFGDTGLVQANNGWNWRRSSSSPMLARRWCTTAMKSR